MENSNACFAENESKIEGGKVLYIFIMSNLFKHIIIFRYNARKHF